MPSPLVPWQVAHSSWFIVCGGVVLMECCYHLCWISPTCLVVCLVNLESGSGGKKMEGSNGENIRKEKRLVSCELCIEG